jgi:hypothetical protein
VSALVLKPDWRRGNAIQDVLGYSFYISRTFGNPYKYGRRDSRHAPHRLATFNLPPRKLVSSAKSESDALS